MAITPDKHLKFDPGLTSLDDDQFFGRGARKIDNGALAPVLAIWPTVHDHDVDGSPVAKVCHADDCTKGISAVCGHVFVDVKYSAASRLPAVKAESIECCGADLSFEDWLIGC